MPPEITAVTTILQLIISGATVVTLIYTLTKFLHAPEQTQDSRIAVCESEIKDIKRRLRDGDSHFASLAHGTDALSRFEGHGTARHTEHPRSVRRNHISNGGASNYSVENNGAFTAS